MCGIAGFCSFTADYKEHGEYWRNQLSLMNAVQKHRGPDEEGIYLSALCGLAHVRLSIIDLGSGQQPMRRYYEDNMAIIVYNGEIYNMTQLRSDLILDGMNFKTTSDTEVILCGYLKYGIDYVNQLNGIFSFAIWDKKREKLFLCRDRCGIKPLFYSIFENHLIFSSEIKGILKFPGFKTCVGREGLCEVFGIGPAKTYGKGVFDGVREVLPGTYLEYDKEGLRATTYWSLKSMPHTDLYDDLYTSVRARNLPCMADVEASMLHFCRKVAEDNKVTLTGECADEIFGGYPWFHRKECFEANCFPWAMDFGLRTILLKEEVLKELRLEEYAREADDKTIGETPRLSDDNAQERRRREIAYLNLKWFMQTLLDRMDRTSMAVGLEARVPFADHRIIEYVWNVPWEMKCHAGIVKGLLRAAGENYLPKEVLYRKKSPYPKTYDPAYESLLRCNIQEEMNDTNSPIYNLVDRVKLESFLKSNVDYGRPFYGQLMAGPQLLAYLLQVNYWIKHYHIEIVI